MTLPKTQLDNKTAHRKFETNKRLQALVLSFHSKACEGRKPEAIALKTKILKDLYYYQYKGKYFGIKWLSDNQLEMDHTTYSHYIKVNGWKRTYPQDNTA